MLAAVCWADVLSAQTPPSPWAWFDAAAEIKAIVGEIIPETVTPGADRAGSAKRIPRSRGNVIESLTPDQRIALLEAIEKTEFFKQVRFHTILGFLGHPMRGGNRDTWWVENPRPGALYAL